MNDAPAPHDASNDLRAEYALDYAKSRPNRFAPRMGETVVTVVIEPSGTMRVGGTRP